MAKAHPRCSKWIEQEGAEKEEIVKLEEMLEIELLLPDPLLRFPEEGPQQDSLTKIPRK